MRLSRHAFLGLSLLLASFPARPLVLDLPGFVEINQFALPSGVPAPLGDVLFSADGSTLFILGASEAPTSGVWKVPVTRDAAGNVVSLGAATSVFTSDSPPLDTSLELRPGTTDTFFFRGVDGQVGQRRPDGTIDAVAVPGATFFGGAAFVPGSLPGAGDLLVSNWDTGVIQSMSFTVEADGSFSIGAPAFYSNTQTGAAGDIHFVPAGPFGAFVDDLMFTDWDNGIIGIVDIDPATGAPAGGGASPTITQFAHDLGVGPWGLEFDPVSGNLFIANWNGSPSNSFIQIGVAVPAPATLSLMTMAMLALLAFRRNRLSMS